MITTTYNFNNGSGLTYPSSLIGFSGGAAKLLLQDDAGLTFAPNFSAAVFSNSAFFEFVGGVLRQKDTRPAGFLGYFSWDSQLNGNYGAGGLTVTPHNGAAVSGGKLDLTGGTNRYVDLPTPGAYVPQQVGTIAFKVTPNYSGTPVDYQLFLTAADTLGGAHNYLTVYHSPGSGSLFLLVYTDNGSAIFVANLGVWNPTAGQEYAVVIQVDVSTGASKVFIDGVQFGATQTGTGSRGVSSGVFFSGKDSNGTSGNADYSIRSLVFYNTIVAPSNAFTVYDYIYNAGTITFPVLNYPGPAGHVQAWQSLAIGDTGVVGYTCNGKYWDGAAWLTSDGSYAQSNPASMVAAHVATLVAADAFALVAVFQPSDTVQETITSVLLTYTGQTYPTTDPQVYPSTPLTLDSISAFSAVDSASGSDGVGIVCKVGSALYWWNGSAWVPSNGSFAQSNPAATVQTNAALLPGIALGIFFTPVVVLHSATGATTPSITSLTLTYDFFGPPPVGPNQCTVFGYIYDESGAPVVGATVTVTNPTSFFNQGVVEAQGLKRAVTDADGYFHFVLSETTTANQPLAWSVVYPPTGVPLNSFTFGQTLVPNTPSANFATMTFTPVP